MICGYLGQGSDWCFEYMIVQTNYDVKCISIMGIPNIIQTILYIIEITTQILPNTNRM
jgi:hypothetical protein